MKIDKLHRITRVLNVEPFKITLLWDNTEVRVNDFEPMFAEWKRGNDTRLFPLFDYGVFRKVKKPNFNALQWPNVRFPLTVDGREQMAALDLDAQVLYAESQPVHHAPLVKVGNLLRRARETAGLSQTDVAARAGTTRNYISRIESGKSNIQLDTLQKIVTFGMGKKLTVEIE